MREVQEDELGNDGNTDSCYTLNDKEPSPSRNAMGVVQSSCDSTGEETSKSSREDSGTVEDGESLSDLSSLVPAAHDEEYTREETRFDTAEDEAEGEHRCVVWCTSHDGAESSPTQHDRWEEDGWTSSTEDHIGRDFADEISKEEYRQYPSISLSVELQIDVHPGNSCISL